MNKSFKKLLMLVLLSFCPFMAGVALADTVSGNVTDEFGEPIIGAFITVQGDASNGTITDYDGNYTLDVPSNAKLVVSYTGYESNTINVATAKSFNVVLKEVSQHLEEVVAVGYGSQKAKEITSSVASVKAENFNQGARESPMGLLQGKVAGLNITRTDGGNPTSTGYNIQLRGFSTLDQGAGTSPLYVVDGIPVDNIDNIAPDDIASMDVLKDGSAAAIYGTRGTNGVILITTKRGGDPGQVECGVANVEYAGYVSVAIPNLFTGLVNDPQEFRNLSSKGLTPSDYGASTNWMKEMTKDAAITHNHNVALSGATKNFSYRGSVNFKDADGVAYNSHRQEIIAKLAANQKTLQGWLDLAYDFSYMHYRNDYFCGSFSDAATFNPTYPIYNADGSYFSTESLHTPVEAMNLKESYQDGNFFRGSVKGTVNIVPVPGLKANAFIAFEEGDNYNYWYNDKSYSVSGDAGKAGRKTDRSSNLLFEATVDYTGQWNGHGLSVVAGYSYQRFEYDGSEMTNGGFTSNGSKYYRMGEGAAENELVTISSYRNSNVLASFFARANYNYKEKYLLSASVRRDGSSRFGENNKWGWFPAASAGWRISGEDFLKDVKGVDDLKLRFGFGMTGNNLNTDLQSLQLYGLGGWFWYNGAWVNTFKPSSNANPYLSWEKKYEYNLGIDYAFFGNRLYGSIDMYLRQTDGLLWRYGVNTGDIINGITLVYDELLANAGKIESKGIELSITGVPVKTKDWNWTSTFTIAFNDNKITELSAVDLGIPYSETRTGNVWANGIVNIETQLLKTGMSVGTFYGYKVDRSLGNNGLDNNGNLIYVDSNGDGNPDEQVIGSAQPLFTFGWNNTIRWKWIDLTLFFRGCYGNDILNVARWAYTPTSVSVSGGVYAKSADEFANGTGIIRNQHNNQFSDYWLEDGSYIKLDNVTLGFTIPLKPNKYVSNLRIYLTAQNLFTITSYSGASPEVNTSSVWDSGIDGVDFYPEVTSVLLGLNVKF